MPGVDYLDVLVYGQIQHIRKRYYIEERKSEVLSFDERIKIQGGLVTFSLTRFSSLGKIIA